MPETYFQLNSSESNDIRAKRNRHYAGQSYSEGDQARAHRQLPANLTLEIDTNTSIEYLRTIFSSVGREHNGN